MTSTTRPAAGPATRAGGTRSKTVLTDVGPVRIDVPRDRDASFEPKIVAKRQKRLGGVDEVVISRAAKGLTTGEISAHPAEVYGAEVSRQTLFVAVAAALPREQRPRAADLASQPPGLGQPAVAVQQQRAGQFGDARVRQGKTCSSSQKTCPR